MELFHEYFYSNNFVMYMDNNPLTYSLTSAKLDVTGYHWVASLANYNFALNYWSGRWMWMLSLAFWMGAWSAYRGHALISQVAQGTTLIEAYSCNIWVTETPDM